MVTGQRLCGLSGSEFGVRISLISVGPQSSELPEYHRHGVSVLNNKLN